MLTNFLDRTARFFIDPGNSHFSPIKKGVAWTATVVGAITTLGIVQIASALWRKARHITEKNDTQNNIAKIFHKIFNGKKETEPTPKQQTPTFKPPPVPQPKPAETSSEKPKPQEVPLAKNTTTTTTVNKLPKNAELDAKLEGLQAKLEDLEEMRLNRMTHADWKTRKKEWKDALKKGEKTSETIELEILTEVAKMAIKDNLKEDVIYPTKEQLTEAIDSIKRDRIINNLYKRRPEKERDKELQKFYESKGENYAQTPLEIDIASFQGKKVYGEWTIDLNQVAIDDWHIDDALDPINLDTYIDIQKEVKPPEEEEGVRAPDPRLSITFRKAFQYVANKIKNTYEKPQFPDSPGLIKIHHTTITSAMAHIDLVPKDPLTGKGRISWADAIFLLLKQEGHVFEVSRYDEVFLQV